MWFVAPAPRELVSNPGPPAGGRGGLALPIRLQLVHLDRDLAEGRAGLDLAADKRSLDHPTVPEPHLVAREGHHVVRHDLDEPGARRDHQRLVRQLTGQPTAVAEHQLTRRRRSAGTSSLPSLQRPKPIRRRAIASSRCCIRS